MSEQSAAGHWLSLSKVAEHAAEHFRDAECKRVMYNIAAAYEALAAASERLQQATELAQHVSADDRSPSSVPGTPSRTFRLEQSSRTRQGSAGPPV